MLLSEIDFTQPKSLEDLKRLVIKRREAYYQELVFSHAERLESISPSFRMKEEEARRCEKQMSHLSVKPCIRNERSEEEETIGSKPKASSNKSGMFGRILKYLSVYEEPSEDASDSDIVPEKTEEELAEEKSLIETANVLRELRMTVQKLRLENLL